MDIFVDFVDLLFFQLGDLCVSIINGPLHP